MNDSHSTVNAAIRERAYGQAPSAPPIPDAVAQATERSKQALATGDADAILTADDALTAAINAASQPPARPRDWGQGARGTRHTPSGHDVMNAIIQGRLT